MKQSTVITVMFCSLAFVIILAPTITLARCGICSLHGIACVNETSFNLCFKDMPDTSQVYTCPKDTVCSHTQFKCVAKDSGLPACKPSKGCGICDGLKMFACTSRTTFAQCHGTKITRNTGVCPENFICDSNSKEICVDECNFPQEIECDRDEPF